MKQPKIKVIDWVKDILSEDSELKALAEKQKEGKIKVWDIRVRPNNSFIVIIYDEIQSTVVS